MGGPWGTCGRGVSANPSLYYTYYYSYYSDSYYYYYYDDDDDEYYYPWAGWRAGGAKHELRVPQAQVGVVYVHTV